MNKEELIKVYEDTKIISEHISINDTVSFKANFDFFNYKLNSLRLEKKKGNIIVLNLDSVSAGEKYANLGSTALLNMCSHKNKGGGVERGSQAQEESLFRCSNLNKVIDNSNYPLKENDLIASGNVTFFKDVNYNKTKHYKLDVISCPAINLKNSDLKRYDFKEYKKQTESKIRAILSGALFLGNDNIILGAFGCGVFENDPNDMCDFFNNVLSESVEYLKFYELFDNIVFAIIDDKSKNYNVFNERIITDKTKTA